MELKNKLKIMKSKRGFAQLMIPLLLNPWFWFGVGIFVLIIFFSAILFVDKLIAITLITIAGILLLKGMGNKWVLLGLFAVALLLLFKGEWVGLDISAGQALSMVGGS